MNVGAVCSNQNRLEEQSDIPSGQNDTVCREVRRVLGTVEERPQVECRRKTDKDDQKQRPGNSNVEHALCASVCDWIPLNPYCGRADLYCGGRYGLAHVCTPLLAAETGTIRLIAKARPPAFCR